MKRIILIVLCQSVIGLLGVFVGMRIGAPILPKPNHIWVGFDPVNRSSYSINNGNHLTIHGLTFVCTNTDRGTRFWKVMFEETTK